MKPSHFIAELYFLKTEEGGRQKPVYSGYRPHIEFEGYPEMKTSGEQDHLGETQVFPGETVLAGIHILSRDYFIGRLHLGKKFVFAEGARVCGRGEILEITDAQLLLSPENKEEKINLNCYPPDILDRLRNDFSSNFYHAIHPLQQLLLRNSSCRNARLIRAIIFLSEKNTIKLARVILDAEMDWRDVLLWAEYTQNGKESPKRIRDFNQKFGEEML